MQRSKDSTLAYSDPFVSRIAPPNPSDLHATRASSMSQSSSQIGLPLMYKLPDSESPPTRQTSPTHTLCSMVD